MFYCAMGNIVLSTKAHEYFYKYKRVKISTLRPRIILSNRDTFENLYFFIDFSCFVLSIIDLQWGNDKCKK